MTAMRAQRLRPRAPGFTLIEAMVTIAILVILLAVVAPSFSTFTYSQRVKTNSFDLFSTLNYARSEAIKRRVNVSVQAVSGDWNNGWTVTDGTNTLRSQGAPKGIAVTSGSGNTALTYRLDGRLTSGDDGLLIAADNSSVADKIGRRCISIDTSGLPRSRKLVGSATTCP